MKIPCSAFLAVFCISVAAEMVYPPSALMENGKNAGVRSASFRPDARERYWKISGIEPGNYSIRLEMSGVPVNCLYRNGVRLEFDSASPFVNGRCIAQTAFTEVKNGDEFFVPASSVSIGTLSLSKERLPFAPQKHVERKASGRDLRYSFEKTTFGEQLKLHLKNRTGFKRKLNLEVKIVDFFRIPVAEYRETVEAGRAFSKTFDYRKGTSDQYRAILKVTDSDGNSREEVFPYLRDWTGTYRSKLWLNDKWFTTSVKDDGSRKTRTLQALPPSDAAWKPTSLPVDFPNHIAWFKREFSVPENFAGERWFLHFDRIAYEADLYLNGEKIYHYGTEVSLAPFDVEITGKFRRKGSNTLLLAVRGKIASLVDSELDKKSPNWNRKKFYANLYQGVSEISLLGMPEKFIGDVKVTTSFRNRTIEAQVDAPEGFRVENRVLHLGREVLKLSGRTKWENPILWGPVEFPLLQLETVLKKDGKTVDLRNTRFGFREIWTDGMDLLWNGKVFRTPARPFMSSWGWFLRVGGARRKAVLDRIRQVKELGNNMLRHIYDGVYFTEFADEEGLIYAQGTVTPAGPTAEMMADDAFWRHKTASDLAAVRARINHPSIFTWYLSNEMFAFSNKSHFKRIRDAVRAVRQADPTRFAEAGCDLDLHGETEIISTHYPVEGQVFREPATYLPGMVYWRDLSKPFRAGDMVPSGQGKNVCNVLEKSPIAWGGKPLIINETGWITFYRSPLGLTRVMGDSVFQSFSYADYGHQLLMKLAFQGARDAGVSVITPWRWLTGDDNDFTIPALDLVVLQRYHTFPVGTEAVFDVNLFHDVLKNETLEFYWTLSENGKTVQQGGRRIPFDFCRGAREKIVLHLKKAGTYELTVGLRGHLERKMPVIVEPGAKLVLKPNMIPASAALNREDLLRRAENGETIILLPRKDYPAWLPGGILATSRKPSVNFTFRPDHPLLKGISERDLSYWYPDHWTGEDYFVKPHAGNAKTIIESGGPEGLKYAGLVEVPYGKGGFLYCALRLDPERNPVAARLLRNMEHYRISPQYRSAGLIAPPESKFAAYCKKYGIQTENASFGSLAKYSVLLVDGKMNFSPAQMAELKAFKGTVFVQNPGESFQLKTRPVKQPEWMGRAIRIGFFPELAGITNQDLFFRMEPPTENIRESFYSAKCLIDPVGDSEILEGTPMLYPVFLARRGNMLFCNLNWMTEKTQLSRQGQSVISNLLTNLGVEIHPSFRLELPKNLKYRPLDLTPYLDRSMADDVQNDGKGGFTDQGPDSDLREFKLNGLHSLAGIPFRIESPKSCFVLKSRYRKGGYESVTIPINSKFEVLAWLHTHAYTSGTHHYSVFVEYADGSKYEIRMNGKVNLRDWVAPSEKFSTEIDTLTETACTVKQKTFGQASLYRTAWINPAPGKRVKSITLRSMNRGVPVILAFSIGSRPEATRITPELESAYEKLLKQAYARQEKQDYRGAIRLYEKALEMIPERLQPYRSIGSCYESLGDYAKAAETYRRSLDADINQPDVLERWNQVRQKQK